MKHAAKCIALGLALLGIAVSPAAAEDYRLGPQDKILVKVVEWRGGQGTYQEWTPIGGEYTISAQGTLSLPLVGDLPAEGKTPRALADAIGAGLQEKLGLTGKPDASVEVTEYRPVFVLGAVDKPGPYPYQPGLTVLKALSLAGGFYRPQDGSGARLGREAIVATGEYQTLRLQAKRYLIRRARLEAEVAGQPTIKMPPELGQEPDAVIFLAQETELMQQRAASLQSKLSGFADLKVLYQNEAKTLGEMMVIADGQIDIAQKELGNVSALVDKGLAVTPRRTELQRTLGDLQSRRLDTQSNQVRAEEEASKADHDAADAVADFKASATADLVQSQDDVRQGLAKLAQARGTLDEATITAPADMLSRLDPANVVTRYAIVRTADGKPAEIDADENAVVQPGDVIRVDVQRHDATADTTAPLQNDTLN